MFFFCKGCSISETDSLLCGKVTRMSVIQWFDYFRDVTSIYFTNNPITFRNTTVHVDEIFIGGKRKYGCGRVPRVTNRYLLCTYKMSHKAAVQFVPKRDFINVIPFMTCNVSLGCTINMDGTRVYNQLNLMNYTHKVVIHKHEFVNQNGHHTNCIEGFWGNLKIKFKSLRGSQRDMLDGHIDEFLYRYNHHNEGPMFHLLMVDIARFYPF